jgi:hypothetical protein
MNTAALAELVAYIRRMALSYRDHARTERLEQWQYEPAGMEMARQLDGIADKLEHAIRRTV